MVYTFNEKVEKVDFVCAKVEKGRSVNVPMPRLVLEMTTLMRPS